MVISSSANLFLLISSVLLLLHHTSSTVSPPPLRSGYYKQTCPDAELTVRKVMRSAMIKEPRHGASVMRLQFHDCFVNGCDGSVLLDATPTMEGEKTSLSNINSLRSFEVIDEIKHELERICPETVSCADIIIIAARDAVALSGGPDWEVKLGRLDSLYASHNDSDNIMPSPRSNSTTLTTLFAQYNLTIKDTVALSGSHTIGQGRCFSIVFRLYNQSGTGKPDPAIEPGYGEKLRRLCPENGDGNVTGGLDGTPERFDNRYFRDLMNGKGFLNSDQTLWSEGGSEMRMWVERFGLDEVGFFDAFVDGMVKLGDLKKVGQDGEIRRDCRVVNSGSEVLAY